MENASQNAVETQNKAKKKNSGTNVVSISGGYYGGDGGDDNDGFIDFTTWDLDDDDNNTISDTNNNNSNLTNAGNDWDQKKKSINIAAPKQGTATNISNKEKIPAPPTAKFEVLSDRSKALIIEPGHRLKLDLRKLDSFGRRALEKKKESTGSKMNETRRGDRLDILGTGISGGGNWLNKMIDNVNEYSITMDVKFNNAPPDEGFSLFQTALVHAMKTKMVMY